MNQKVIVVKGNKKDQFVRLIAAQFGIYAEMEVKLLHILIDNDLFNPFHLDKILKYRLVSSLGVTTSTFITTMNRLVKKGALARSDKNYFMSIAFRSLADIDCIVFKYEDKSKA